jgi:hypothetical protein
VSQEKVMKETIPFPFAVAITVSLLLILGFFLGKWNFTLWVVFITWAEYFVFGATPSVGKAMLPGLAIGCFTAAVWMANWVFFMDLFNSQFPDFVSWLIISGTNFIWVVALCYIILRVPMFQAYGLALFNGLTLFLAVYFTFLGGAQNVIPMHVGDLTNPYWVIIWTFIWTLLMEWVGYFAAVFNVWITFPREVKA